MHHTPNTAKIICQTYKHAKWSGKLKQLWGCLRWKQEFGIYITWINVRSHNMSCCSVDLSIINLLKYLHLFFYFTYFFLLLFNIPVINKSVPSALKNHVGESSIIDEFIYLKKWVSERECTHIRMYSIFINIYRIENMSLNKTGKSHF